MVSGCPIPDLRVINGRRDSGKNMRVDEGHESKYLNGLGLANCPVMPTKGPINGKQEKEVFITVTISGRRDSSSVFGG